MSRFGAWLAERRMARIALIAAFFPLGILGLLSTAGVSLTAILKGWREATTDSLLAGGVLLVLTVLTQGQWQALLVSAGLIWPLAIALGALTGRFGTLILPVQALVVVAVAGVALFSVMASDPATYWLQTLEVMATEMAAMGVQFSDPTALAALAPLMTGIVAASAFTSFAAALILGSWWAAGAGGPEFGAMFRALQLGNIVGLLAGLAGLLAAFLPGALGSNLLLVFGMGFALQGLAVVHWQAHQRAWPGYALLLVYGPLLMGAVIASAGLLALATLGFVDNWYSLRRTGADVIK
ncbi:MAG: hypothetical protein ACR2QB_09290 [Gammaproteobacteria bacterium]